MKLGETLTVDEQGWVLTETGWDRDRAVAVGSNFLAGNGYLGYRGTSAEQGVGDYVALVVTDTYDCADGVWRELTTVPNPLLVSARIADEELSIATGRDVASWLDLRSGEFGTRFTHEVDGATVVVNVERFASYDSLHLLAQRWSLTTDREIVVEVDAGFDADIWSLNGVHLPEITLEVDGAVIVASATTGESNIDIGVAAATTCRRC